MGQGLDNCELFISLQTRLVVYLSVFIKRWLLMYDVSFQSLCLLKQMNNNWPAGYKSHKQWSSYNLISSPPLSPDDIAEEKSKNHFLSPTKTSPFHLPTVKMLRKTPSVRQLYQSLLQALRNISGNGDDILPELTKPFFEKILRDCEKKQSLQVIKVKLRDKQEFGRHFCSEVHAVDVTVKERAQILFVIYIILM